MGRRHHSQKCPLYNLASCHIEDEISVHPSIHLIYIYIYRDVIATLSDEEYRKSKAWSFATMHPGCTRGQHLHHQIASKIQRFIVLVWLEIEKRRYKLPSFFTVVFVSHSRHAIIQSVSISQSVKAIFTLWVATTRDVIKTYRNPIIMTCQGIQGLHEAFLVQSEGQVHGHSALAHTSFTCAGGKVQRVWGQKSAPQNCRIGQSRRGSPNHCRTVAFSDTSYRFIYSTHFHVRNEPLSGGWHLQVWIVVYEIVL